MKIGIYGGTFDPPHLGHMRSARRAMDALGLDKLIFMPASQPPHKDLSPHSAGREQRLAMLSIAADGLLLPERVEVSRLEMEREGKSYTSDTLRQLRRCYPEDELWLLMGSDMFLSLQTWHEPETVMSLAGICAFARKQGDSAEKFNAQAKALRDTFGARVELLSQDVTEISSTRLRALLCSDRGEAARFLPAPVYGYILRHGLYGVHADLKALSDEELRACSWSMVRAKRIAHIKGTEEEARRLALRWGADPEKAARAGILHDCTKYLEMEEQKALCRHYGIVLDELESQAVKLLHSKTGAAIARDIFGVGDDIFWAIYWHTTGKADMTVLEKILYIADYMEPTRAFEGVERLRKLAYEDLDRAVLAGFEMSIQEMNSRKLPVHRNTLEGRDWMLRHGKG